MQLFEEELKVQPHLKVSRVIERERSTAKSYCEAKVQRTMFPGCR